MAGKSKVTHPRSISPWRAIVVAVVVGIGFLAWRQWRRWISRVELGTVKPAYYHYEFIELRIRTRDPELLSRWKASPPLLRILRGGEPVKTIAGIADVPAVWDETREAFIGRWPCPWNAPAVAYMPAFVQDPGLGNRLRTVPFRIQYRKPLPVPRRLVVLTMETVAPLAGIKVRTPEGTVTNWRGLLDWAKYIEADAFWILVGQTPGQKPGTTWVTYNFPLIPQLAKECHRRGLQLGVWAMCYLTMSKERLPRYRYAMDVKDGKPVYTRAISIDDPRRPEDVVELLKTFRDQGADYLGLDYVRNAMGGYELVDDFVKEMPGLRLPPEWPKLNRDERIVWLARKKIMRRDKEFIDAWQWWRAHRVALVVQGIKRELGDQKPLWTFTLTWDKGWHHGQDPVMMNDAGADLDSLMLYEATGPQFEQIVKDWRSYVRRGDVRLVVGDVVDWPLHQRSPRGPGEFYYRITRAARDIYGDGPAAGMFVHDLARALGGRLGPYSTLDWMQAARSAARRFKGMPDMPAVVSGPGAPAAAEVIPVEPAPVRAGNSAAPRADFDSGAAGRGAGKQTQ